MGVSRAGFYRHLSLGKQAERSNPDALDKDIETLYQAKHRRYGAPRIHRALRRQGYNVSLATVGRRMRKRGLIALGKRRRRPNGYTTERNNLFPNLLRRQFYAQHPNQIWVSDITFLETAGRWSYLCTVIDLYSRAVVGWSFHKRAESTLVTSALTMALWRRNPQPGLIFHSDQGAQYRSLQLQELCDSNRIRQSMSAPASCLDNAVAESFFATLKRELARSFVSFAVAKRAIFEYIEGFYNCNRDHSFTGFVPPMTFEQLNCAA